MGLKEKEYYVKNTPLAFAKIDGVKPKEPLALQDIRSYSVDTPTNINVEMNDGTILKFKFQYAHTGIEFLMFLNTVV